MAYNEILADRIRKVLVGRTDVVEQKMFGGLSFMVGGHMACGVLGQELVVRVGKGGDDALAQPHVRPFDFTGRPTRGMVYVAPAGVAADQDLQRWVDTGLAAVAARS